jgi:hypothetical protein
MAQILLIGLGAGAASALLFASIVSGSLLAILLFYLAPLPIMLAALGWNHWAALVGAITGALGLSIAFGSFFLFAFLVTVGLPAWWLGYLSLLARPAAEASPATPDGLDWYPVGRIVLWSAVIGALVVVAAIPNFGFDEESFRAGLRRGFERLLRPDGERSGTPLDLPGRPDTQRVVEFLITVIPPTAAVLNTVTSLINLWLAAVIVKLSGRLRRPWPQLSQMKLPSLASILLAIAVAASFLPGLIGIFAGVFTASLLMAFAVAGFAALHSLTMGVTARGVVLGGIYAAVLVFGWPLLLVALLGIVDATFNIRGRVAHKGGPPTLSS